MIRPASSAMLSEDEERDFTYVLGIGSELAFGEYVTGCFRAQAM